MTFGRLGALCACWITQGWNRMAEDVTPEDRLEAALNRIAKVLDAPDPVATEVAERLDGIIATLRDALAK